MNFATNELVNFFKTAEFTKDYVANKQ